jgi:NAD(P)-dependent dehydrogenase (short-subunit alcohol dehydrogenase family)
MWDARTFDFTGKTVLVTGAASGIGAAMAEEFHRQGATLKLADRNEPELTVRAQQLGPNVECHIYDQANTASVLGLAEWAGTVDVLMNNAGIVAFGEIQSHSPELLTTVINTNLTGPIMLANAIATGMLARRSGVIVNTTSQLAFCGAPQRAVYASAKAGLAQFTKSVAAEWAPHGVRVLAIAPGRTLTALNSARLSDPAVREAALGGIPLGRFGSATEIAKIALFLASDAAEYVVGHSLIADGGYVIAN